MDIRRWASYNDRGYYSNEYLVDHELGDWVKYNDHVKVVDKLNATVTKYEAGEKPWDSITGEDYND